MPRDVPLQQYDPFVKRVIWALREKCGVAENDSILVAVSGGADSVALLRALAVVAPRRRWNLRLAVGHVNHHLRPEAHDEAEFVRNLARGLGIPDFRSDIDVLPRHDPNDSKVHDATPSQSNLEASARKLRYAALARMASAAGASFVATAHHSDDQIETVLMRMLRGASVQGMAGMSWRRRMSEDRGLTLIRPMLGNDHSGAAKFLAGIGQTWCEDLSNQDPARVRARLRLKVLPVLKSIQPRIGPLMVAEGEHLRQVGKLLDQQILKATQHVRTEAGGTSIARSELQIMNKAVVSGLLRGLLMQSGCPRDRLGARTIKPILTAIADHQGGNRTFQMSGSVVVHINATSITIRRGPKNP